VAGTSRQCSGILHGNCQVDSGGGKIKRFTSRGSRASQYQQGALHPCAMKVAEGVEDGSSLNALMAGRERHRRWVTVHGNTGRQDEILHRTTTMAMHEN